MNDELFSRFSNLVYKSCGICLPDGKQALVVSRISKRLRALKISSEEEYYNYLTHPQNSGEIIHFLDVISTNVTHFFREPEHFSQLQQILGTWRDQGQKRLRIWCAASSTGEEPYTLAMVTKETVARACDAKILATDISTRVLETAIRGEYNIEQLQNIPKDLREKYFHESGSHHVLSASNELRSLLLFRRLNLKNNPLPLNGDLDIIFCRNVMIYFDNVLKQQLVDEFMRLLKPGGYLFISHTESLSGLKSPFKMLTPSVYQKSLAGDDAHAWRRG